MRSSRATMKRRYLASNRDCRERTAWRCSICSFRRNALAATRWAPVFALRARLAVRPFTSPFRRFVSLLSVHMKARYARRCWRSKTADETSRRRWLASWRRSSTRVAARPNPNDRQTPSHSRLRRCCVGCPTGRTDSGRPRRTGPRTTIGRRTAGTLSFAAAGGPRPIFL